MTLGGGTSAATAAASSDRHPVLMISIDGLRPDYVFDADKYHLAIPVLRGFVARGAYAHDVVNVNPTLTFPNHTTLVTGVLPREHGITSNTIFDPERKEHGDWYWFYSQIKVQTLWHAAKSAGLVTASIGWPATVHAADIDYNIPEYAHNSTPWAHHIMEAVSQPFGYLEAIEKDIGPFYIESDILPVDRRIEAAATWMMAHNHPDFLTIHLGALDHEEHLHAPFSPQALAALEEEDAVVGRLIVAERKVHPDAVIVVASDHGFFRLTHLVNLNVAFAKAGLFELADSNPKAVKSWKAFVWNQAVGAVVLKDSKDERTRAQAKAILQKLASDPANGIARVYEGGEIAALGMPSDLAFVVDFKPDYSMGDNVSGPLVTDIDPPKGNHGVITSATTRLDLHSALFIEGPGIAAGRNLGSIDMRRIAPTVARMMQVSLPSAKMAPLPVTGS